MRGRLVGEHFKLNGQPKKAFASRQAAERFIVETNQSEHFHSYRCGFCRKWHVATIR